MIWNKNRNKNLNETYRHEFLAWYYKNKNENQLKK
jgi:hypothetical protein